ncbi:MAG: geranylgeranylglyceryl/heptaprenylglyceryl phosphate synthase [Chitinophagaceae bacterium]|nr:geranylgeranylglyceryl/heptaprenylglyceryl phosphate synthase [Chitinophagaceae bacterium]
MKNNNKVYASFLAAKKNRQKQLAVLIDPDKVTPESLVFTVEVATKAAVDYFFIGGSLLVNDTMGECIDVIKSCSDIPVVIFPGSPAQINDRADAILYLSLISGRNPELLIGQHVAAAPVLKNSGLEIISTGYILIDGGITTTVSYVSNTIPIPNHKDDIAMCTAMAGEMLGLKTIYLDAGSGALKTISESMIQLVSENIEVPLIAGGGIRSAEMAASICKAGADIVVVGNAIEKDPMLIFSIAHEVQSVVSSE